MKKSILILLTVATLHAISCKSDDHDSPVSLIGTWNLVSVRGGLAGVQDDFAMGTITWTFHDDLTVTIVNNNSDAAAEDFFDTGVYDFMALVSGHPEQCNTELTISGTSMGCMQLTASKLKLTQLETDGFELTLRRE